MKFVLSLFFVGLFANLLHFPNSVILLVGKNNEFSHSLQQVVNHFVFIYDLSITSCSLLGSFKTAYLSMDFK